MSDSVKGTARVRDGRIEVSLSLPIVPADDPPGAAAPARAPDPPDAHGRPTHSPDFAGVNWFGATYHFTPKQRSVVAALWRAWEQGYECVGQDTLLELADSDQTKLRELFRGHPAWGTMIVSAAFAGGPAGAYRLNVPR